MITETPIKSHLVHEATKSLIVTGTVCAFFLGCETIDQIQNEFRDLTPHEMYQESLISAGLNGTALALEWLEASESALMQAPEVETPFQEEGFFSDASPQARGYKISLRRGQQLSVSLVTETELPLRMFVDIYRLQTNPDASPFPVISTESTLQSIEYVSPRTALYVVRIQPELLRNGRYRIQLTAEGSMAFPVKDRNTLAILSSFGVERDGGRRQHHGVDIFAPRGTPVISATPGYVSRVENTPIGGKVVWVRDQGPNSIYYAHLDSQVVASGAKVEPGTLLGFVGNTGNARTTPPHLHFGVYRRGEGPVDPYYFLYSPPALSSLPANETQVLGFMSRTTNSGIRLRTSPSQGSQILREMKKNTSFLILATTGSWQRVLLPDDQVGFVASRLTENASIPLRVTQIEYPVRLMSAPNPTAPMIELIGPGSGISVLGNFNSYHYVQTQNGILGWIANEQDLAMVEDR
ncbi:MAG TPA: M23 family peptidase [Gemmatimonadetes bacterium]|jgi:murein DD-endopeptidase MepM/ murein hydrolase activator NlpD/SH3-like domain-containing protein|nr:M23 family peptidase [Gemmatimonadota bacterium]